MSNNIDDLKVKLKYCKKERLKELFKDGDFLMLVIAPLGCGVISGIPFMINDASTKSTMVAMGVGASLGLSIGSMHFFTKFHDSIYTKKIRVIREEIKEIKEENKSNVVKQKKLK